MKHRGYELRLMSDGTFEAWMTTSHEDVGFLHPSSIERIVTTARTEEEAMAQIDNKLRKKRVRTTKDEAQLDLFNETGTLGMQG